MSLRRAFLLAALLGGAVPAAAQTAPAAATEVEVPVLVRDVAKDELLSASDFAVEPRPASQVRGALEIGSAAGKEALRQLRAGSVVRSGDLIKPQLVRRGEPVSITVRNGGLTITAQGRALSGGGQGDLIRVVNTTTNRTLDGIVDKTGSVRIAAN